MVASGGPPPTFALCKGRLGPRKDSRRACWVASAIVTDVVLPEMSGVKLAESLLRSRPRMAVIYMSGYTEETIEDHGVERARMAFLAKPFTMDALLRKVREVLDGGKRPS